MKSLSQKRGFNLGFSILFNAIIMLFIITVFNVEFEIADDVIFSQFITDGFYNIIFINVFLTRFIGFIQNIIYPLNAYVLIDLALAYLSMVSITKIFIDKFEIKKATLMMILVNGFFAINYYLTISFTRLPGLLATAGFLSIIHYSRQKNWALGTVWGIILVIISSMYRFNVFELMFGVALAFVFCVSLGDFFDTDKKDRKLINLIKIIFEPKRFISAVIIVVIAFSLNYVSKDINTSTDVLKHYASYTSARAASFDYDIPSYEQAKEEYDKLGIDENDLTLLKAGFMDEDGAFTTEQLLKIKSIRDNYNKSKFSLIKTIYSTIKNIGISVVFLQISGVTLISFGITFLMYFVFQKKNKFLIPLIMAMTVGAIYLYFNIMGRLVFRVLFSVIFAAVCYLFYTYDFSRLESKEKSNIKTALSIICVIAISAAGLYLTTQKNEHIDYYPHFEEAKQISEYVNENQDKKFEFARATMFTCGIPDTNKDVFHIKKTDYDVNYKVTNCTYYLSPYYYRQMEGFGAENFYSNLLNDNVYFVVRNKTDYGENIKQYLQKYYSNNKSVNMDLVKEIGGYTVYNYYLN